MKFDVYGDIKPNNSVPEVFVKTYSGVTAEFICECTGRHIDDFNEDIAERGFNEFEIGRRMFALAIPADTKIPDDAYMANRK